MADHGGCKEGNERNVTTFPMLTKIIGDHDIFFIIIR